MNVVDQRFGGTIGNRTENSCVEKGKTIKQDQADTTPNQPQHDEPIAKPKLTRAQGNRLSQTAKAMTYSVLATLAIVLGWLAINPQANNEFDPGIDVEAVEAEVAEVAVFTPAVVDMPDTWRANYARWSSGTQDDTPAWNIGYLTDDEEFFGISQTANATGTWVKDKINPVGEATEVTVANHAVQRWIGQDDHIYLVAEFAQPAVDESELLAGTPEPSDTMTLILSGSMDEETLYDLAGEIIAQYR